MTTKLWIAGESRTPDPQHRMAERATHYGDGVFVTLACEDRVLLDADAQLGRLGDACARVGLPVPASVVSVAALVDVLRSLGAAESPDFMARVQVSAGPSGRGYGRAEDGESWELIEIAPTPAVRTCRAALPDPDLRLPIPALPDVKSCSALAHVLAAREAARLGVDELIRTADGAVTEATASNVFWSTGGVLHTPAASLPLYPGVTRAVVFQTARDVGLEVEESEHPAASIAAADSVFLTNAARGMEPVAELDGASLAWPDSLARLALAVAETRRSRGVRL